MIRCTGMAISRGLTVLKKVPPKKRLQGEALTRAPGRSRPAAPKRTSPR